MRNELALRHLLLSEMRELAGCVAGDDSATAMLGRVRRSLTVAHERPAHVYRVSARGPSGPVSLDIDERTFRFYTPGDVVESCDTAALAARAAVAGENARQARELTRRLLAEAGASLPGPSSTAETSAPDPRHRARQAGRLIALTAAGGAIVASAHALRGSTTSLWGVAAVLTLLLGTSGTLLAVGVGWRMVPVLLAIPVVALATVPSGTVAVVPGPALCVISQWILVAGENGGRLVATRAGAGAVAGLAVAVSPSLGIANAIFSAAVLGLGWLLHPGRRVFPLLAFPIMVIVVGTAAWQAGLRPVASGTVAEGAPALRWLELSVAAAGAALGIVYWTIGTHRNVARMLLPFWVVTMVWAGRSHGLTVGPIAALSAMLLGLVVTLSTPLRRLATPAAVTVTIIAAGVLAAIFAQVSLTDGTAQLPPTAPR